MCRSNKAYYTFLDSTMLLFTILQLLFHHPAYTTTHKYAWRFDSGFQVSLHNLPSSGVGLLWYYYNPPHLDDDHHHVLSWRDHTTWMDEKNCSTSYSTWHNKISMITVFFSEGSVFIIILLRAYSKLHNLKNSSISLHTYNSTITTAPSSSSSSWSSHQDRWIDLIFSPSISSSLLDCLPDCLIIIVIFIFMSKHVYYISR